MFRARFFIARGLDVCPVSGRNSDSASGHRTIFAGAVNDVRSLGVGKRCGCLGRTMTLPRAVIPGRMYMLTRRTTQRTYLLRPDEETNNAFLYCLAEAAQRYGIGIVLTQMMSNHHHTVVYDENGRINEFTEHFHKMFARCQNVLRGRCENLWSSAPPSVVELVDRADVINKLAYVALNPVAADLVEKVHHWPGIAAYGAFIVDRELEARRPHYFFRAHGTMPATVTLRFQVPAILGDRDELVQAVRARIEEDEAELARKRRAAGILVLGRRGVLRQSWNASPSTFEPKRALRPTVAARDPMARRDALLRRREFVSAYRLAREALLLGLPAVFPRGTYWLRRFAGVSVADSPPESPTLPRSRQKISDVGMVASDVPHTTGSVGLIS